VDDDDENDSAQEMAEWLTFDLPAAEFKDLEYLTLDVKVLRDGVLQERNFPRVTGYVQTAVEPAVPVAYHVLPGARMRFSSLVKSNNLPRVDSSSLLDSLLGGGGGSSSSSSGGRRDAKTPEEKEEQHKQQRHTNNNDNNESSQDNTSRSAIQDMLRRHARLRLDVDVALERCTASKLTKSRVLSTFVSPKRRVFLEGNAAWKMPFLLEQSLGMAFRAANALAWKLNVLLNYEKNWKRRMLLTYDKTKLETLLANQFDDQVVPHAIFLTKASIQQLSLFYSPKKPSLFDFTGSWETSVSHHVVATH